MLDFDAWASSIAVANCTKSYANGVFSITANANGDGYTNYDSSATAARFSVIPGKTYVLSWTHTGSDGRVMIFPNSTTTGLKQVNTSTANQLEYTATEGITFVTFRVGVSSANATASYSNITFCEKGQEVRPGTVWFENGMDSATPFNALNKNGIVIYPMDAKQYLNNAWVKKNAEIYQAGSWHNWFNGVLFSYGTKSDFAGDWEIMYLWNNTAGECGGTVTFVDNYMSIKGTSMAVSAPAVCSLTLNPDFIKGYSTAYVKVANLVTQTLGQASTSARFCVFSSATANANQKEIAGVQITGPGIYSLPLDGIDSGILNVRCYYGTLNIYEFWVE